MSPNESYWVASTPVTAFPTLQAEIAVDVAVLGAGIVGTTAALLLRRHGLDVALLERDRVGLGTTGHTTAKLTAGHNLIYESLERKHGAGAAKLYAAANEDGIEFVSRMVDKEGVDCDFERKANYVYVEDADEVDAVQAEVEACRRAGLDAGFVTETTLPYAIAGAVRLPGEAQFHPRKYLLELVERFTGEGGTVFEDTRATGLREGGRNLVRTPGGSVRADHVVVATHYPFIDRSLIFARVHPKRSYAIAGPVEGALPDGMFISADQPTRSIRTIPDGDRTLLLVGGEGHAVGQERETTQHYGRLEEWARARFGIQSVEYRWSAQDGVPVDQLPFVGPYRVGASVYVAAGFQKWGLAMGTTAARIIVDRITSQDNPYAKLFDPVRLAPRASLGRLVKENAKIPRYLAVDRLTHPQRRSVEELQPGEGGIVSGGLRPVAAYRDETGELHRVSAVCTHLGCVVSWNGAERSWDCPCHGSRYGVDGRVIEGPATRDLGQLN
ncbi:MAG: FAD-dependent oxidoreductase [Actinomycetota bacterium]